MYDVSLTWFESTDSTSTSKRRQSDVICVICTTFTFYNYVLVTKDPYNLCVFMAVAGWGGGNLW